MKQYQMQLSHFLKGYLRSAQERNQLYSMRSFANKLNVNSGNLSQIISGKRQVSRDKASQILNQLDIDEHDYSKIMFSNKSNDENFIFDKYFSNFCSYKDIKGEELDQLLSSDLYFKVLSLSETKGFILDEVWISKKLNTKVDSVRTVLKYLVDCGDINPNKNSQIINKYYKSSDCETNQTIRKYHKSSLQEAANKIDELSTEERDITSVIFACNKKNYEQAQDLIRSFHKQLVSLMTTGEKTDVYKLNVQLYPCAVELEGEDD